MKAHLTISYNPNNLEDAERIRQILNVQNYVEAIERFDNEVLRPVVKYGCGDDVREEIYEELRDKLFAILKEEGV